MDFFGDLGKRFSNVAKSVSEKTKDSVEVQRIGNDIRVQRNTLEQLYTDLGRTVYAVRTGDAEEAALEPMFENIARVMARIEELDAQRDTIRDVRRCPNCGTVSTREAKFCAQCGAKMPEDAPVVEEIDEAEYCPDCGAQRKDEAAYCEVCGKVFGEAEAECEEAAEEEAVEEKKEEVIVVTPVMPEPEVEPEPEDEGGEEPEEVIEE